MQLLTVLSIFSMMSHCIVHLQKDWRQIYIYWFDYLALCMLIQNLGYLTHFEYFFQQNCRHDFRWYHGPRRGQEEAPWRQNCGILLLKLLVKRMKMCTKIYTWKLTQCTPYHFLIVHPPSLPLTGSDTLREDGYRGRSSSKSLGSILNLPLSRW